MARVKGNLRDASFLVVLLALVFSGSIDPSEAQVCVNGFQCLSCTQAQFCVGSAPVGNPITCPTGYYCINSASMVCTYGTCPTATAFVCNSEGRYPDPLDPNKYYLCVSDSTVSTGLRQISITCPTGSTFNSVAMQCMLITTTTTTTTTTAATTTISTTTPTTTTAAPIYPCTAVGRFRDTTNCSNYYTCQVKPAGGFYAYKYTCPTTTLFSPSTLKCMTAALSGCTVTG